MNKKNVNDIILLEKFREFLQQQSIGDYYVIDRPSFSKMPDCVGCFQENRKWIVYENDEYSNQINIIQHRFLEDAIRDAAHRFACIVPSSVLKVNCQAPEEIDYAIKSLKNIRNHCQISEVYEILTRKILTLNRARHEVNRTTRVVSRQQLLERMHW